MADDNTDVKPEPKPAPKEPETFSREYVSELRNENKTYRLKANDAETKAKEAADAVAKAQKEADDKIAAATKSAEERILRSELKAAALKAGMVDLDGLKLADLSKVKLNDAVEVEGADALMESLKKDKPYLFGTTGSSSSTGKKPDPTDDKPKKATEMTDAEYAALKKKAIAGKL